MQIIMGVLNFGINFGSKHRDLNGKIVGVPIFESYF